MTRRDIISALKDTCSMLDERKTLFEKMIAALETEDQAAECELEEEVREAEQEAEEDAEAKTDKADEADDTEGEEDEESEDSSSED
jgi:phosphopantothenoylcysteine synthetase/decarboxylase